MSDAKGLYQTWLDKVAEATWSSDFATVGAAMTYPHVMQTADGEVFFDTAQKLIEAAADFRRYLTSIGAQAYMRLCTEASFAKDAARIDGRHMTYIMRGGSYLVPPFSNDMTLILAEGRWLGAGIRAGCTNHHCTILSPVQLRKKHLAAAKSHAMEDKT